MKINTEIRIDASSEKVWETLMDVESYSKWNPLVKSISGIVKEGERIKVDLPGMTFKPTVLVINPSKEFRWLGHLFIKGLFDGEHCFELMTNKDGSTTFLHSEQFSGILVPLFKRWFLSGTKTGFEVMNKKLKERVEAAVFD